LPGLSLPEQCLPERRLPEGRLPEGHLPERRWPGQTDQPLPDQPLPDQPLPDQPLPDQPLPDQPGLADRPSFTALPDLASRRLGGSVIFANDELFAEKENLIKPEPPRFAAEFGHKGKIYDGWETRRRRTPGHDYAIVRLGAPGVVHGVVVDTAHFRGNFPAQISVEAASAEGYPGPEQLAELDWQTLIPATEARGDTANHYSVADRRRWTHVRLSIYPDGGVARFRVHGRVVPDPRFLAGTIDLLAMENGGELIGCSDAFYSSAANLILPGWARSMAEGWENARRRGAGNDYATFRLGAAGGLRYVEVDTSYFVGNAPGWIRLHAADERAARPVPDGGDGPAVDEMTWWEVLPRLRVQPDTRHRFLVDSSRAATHVRLDVIPDGGLARLRVHGEVVPEGLTQAWQRWHDSLPEQQRQSLPPEG
jgi:allantoicase